jgi:hypothetical protein
VKPTDNDAAAQVQQKDNAQITQADQQIASDIAPLTQDVTASWTQTRRWSAMYADRPGDRAVQVPRMSKRSSWT